MSEEEQKLYDKYKDNADVKQLIEYVSDIASTSFKSGLLNEIYPQEHIITLISPLIENMWFLSEEYKKLKEIEFKRKITKN